MAVHVASLGGRVLWALAALIRVAFAYFSPLTYGSGLSRHAAYDARFWVLHPQAVVAKASRDAPPQQRLQRPLRFTYGDGARGTPNRTAAEAKRPRLADWLRDQGSVAIGYSGGVDSAYLAAVAVATLAAPRNVLAIIGRSASYPDSQWLNAREVASQIGLAILEVDTDELNDPRYAANPSNRCYFCKTELWSRLVPLADGRGIAVVADGTNADDLQGHRPGAQAAKEHGVVSPLALFEFSKDEIRARSRALGLPTWQQPSSPCLSSRIPRYLAPPVTVGRLRPASSGPRRRFARSASPATFEFGTSVIWPASS